MSAENYYQPHVYISGVQLPEGLGDGSGQAALARLEIKWGSDDWFSNIDPSRATLTVRNNLPNWGRDVTASAAPVRITRDPDGTVIFEGLAIESTTDLITVSSPHGGQIEKFEHRLIAEDPLGAMQRDRRRGPTWKPREGEDEVAHWGPCTMEERRSSLQLRSTALIAFADTPLDQYDDLGSGGYALLWPVTPYERSQVVSALTVLRNTVRIASPLARPIYVPSTGTIRPMTPPRSHAGGLSVGTYWGYVYIESGIGTDYLIEGQTLSMPEGAGVESTAVELVSQIELSLRACRPNQLVTSANSSSGTRQRLEWVDQPQTFTTTRKAESQMTVALDCDHSPGFYGNEYGCGPMWYGIRIAEQTNFYGVPKIRPIRYKFKKRSAVYAPYLAWLQPAPEFPNPEQPNSPAVYRLVDSKTNYWPEAPAFSIIGGVLSYSAEQGWIADLYPVAVSQDTTHPRPTLGDLASSTIGSLNVLESGAESTVADWQQIQTLP